MFRGRCAIGPALLGAAMLCDGAFAQPREKCNLEIVRDTFLRADQNRPFASADFALEDLQTKMPPKDVFSKIDPKQAEQLRARAVELVDAGRKAFDALLGDILRQQSKACLVCSLKQAYGNAMRANRLDVTVAELSDPGVHSMFISLRPLIDARDYWKTEYERLRREKGPDHYDTRDADRQLQTAQSSVDRKLVILDQYRERNPSPTSERMSDLADRYECYPPPPA